jgi:hypothetical protein
MPIFNRSNFEVSLKTLLQLLRITFRPILCKIKIVDGISYNKDEAKIILIEKLLKKGQNRSIFLLRRILKLSSLVRLSLKNSVALTEFYSSIS